MNIWEIFEVVILEILIILNEDLKILKKIIFQWYFSLSLRQSISVHSFIFLSVKFFKILITSSHSPKPCTQLPIAQKMIFILAAIEIWVKKFFKITFLLLQTLNFHDQSPPRLCRFIPNHRKSKILLFFRNQYFSMHCLALFEIYVTVIMQDTLGDFNYKL